MDFIAPEISEAGHLISTRSMVSVTPEEKAVMMRSVGCPVNRKIKTKMLEVSFTKMCLLYQDRAGVGEEETCGKAVSTATGFISSNYYVCGPCEIGRSVKAGERFSPPFNLSFADAEPIDPNAPVVVIAHKVRRKRIRRAGARCPRNKLAEAEAILVWEMSTSGSSVLEIHGKLGDIVGKGAIYNILNGLTWKYLYDRYSKKDLPTANDSEIK